MLTHFREIGITTLPRRTVPTVKNPCAYCGKEAIGIQIYGCCSVTVCSDHADEQLKVMHPGERKDLGACYLYRFP